MDERRRRELGLEVVGGLQGEVMFAEKSAAQTPSPAMPGTRTWGRRPADATTVATITSAAAGRMRRLRRA